MIRRTPKPGKVSTLRANKRDSHDRRGFLARVILKTVGMPPGKVILYGISIGGMMLGPTLVARYLAHRWQSSMAPFYWGLLIPVIAYGLTLPGSVVLSQIILSGSSPAHISEEREMVESLFVAVNSAIWSLSFVLAIWTLFRTVLRQNFTPRSALLLALGSVALTAFFSGFILAHSVIRVAVANASHSSEPGLSSSEAVTAQIERLQHQKQYLLEGPFFVPALPLLRVIAFTPWLIFFSLLIFWGVACSKPHYIALAFILQFGLGFATAAISEQGPPHPAHELLVLSLMLAVSSLPFIASRAIFRLAQQNPMDFQKE